MRLWAEDMASKCGGEGRPMTGGCPSGVEPSSLVVVTCDPRMEG